MKFKFYDTAMQMVDISDWPSLDAAVQAAVKSNQGRRAAIGDPRRIQLVAAVTNNGISRTLTQQEQAF